MSKKSSDKRRKELRKMKNFAKQANIAKLSKFDKFKNDVKAEIAKQNAGLEAAITAVDRITAALPHLEETKQLEALKLQIQTAQELTLELEEMLKDDVPVMETALKIKLVELSTHSHAVLHGLVGIGTQNVPNSPTSVTINTTPVEPCDKAAMDMLIEPEAPAIETISVEAPPMTEPIHVPFIQPVDQPVQEVAEPSICISKYQSEPHRFKRYDGVVQEPSVSNTEDIITPEHEVVAIESMITPEPEATTDIILK